eukprot:TRINITY_DN22035_c0_g1_i1.p1 TRINITY_DN22035_c0_g1~~TRINITY_DN22035_c0_g1_i1.p1  ORF type:complete len:577 (+),score=114.10 TRINITY_DN22035_c0_g1_i1:67-1797(+)
MFHRTLRHLCREQLGLVVLDRQLIQVIPNKLSVKVDNCELRGLSDTSMPLWKIESDGMAGKEITMVRDRDIMRPRDHSMILSLFEMIENMDLQGRVNECTEIPLEIGRKERKPSVAKNISPDGFDHLSPPTPLPAAEEITCWLIFYEHPLLTSASILLITPEMRDIRDRFKTPLRLTNLLFKYMSWNYIPPAIYTDSFTLPTTDQMMTSALAGYTDRAIACPGITITMKQKVCFIEIPKTAVALEVFSDAGIKPDSDDIIIIASRHRKNVDCFSCWDPKNQTDSLVISTSNEVATNWNEKGAATPSSTGLTFVRFTQTLSEGEMIQEEDGVVIGVNNGSLDSIFSMQNLESDEFSITFVDNTEFGNDLPAPSDDTPPTSDTPSDDFDWLSYIEQKVEEKKVQKQSQKNAIKRRHMGDLDTSGPVMTHVNTTIKKVDDAREAEQEVAKSTPTEEVKEEERTTVEPRMVKASFGEFQSDPRANDELWEKFVIRIATVMSAVFAHCGRRKRPTLGKDEPASVTIDMSIINEKPSFTVSINEEVCTMELIPQGIDLLTEKLNSRCDAPPHLIPLTLQFSL